MINLEIIVLLQLVLLKQMHASFNYDSKDDNYVERSKLRICIEVCS